MKNVAFLGSMTIIVMVFSSSCSKNKCHDCHYDKAGMEIELGEYCGDELKQLEALGTFTDSTGTYTVHCHEH
ncbi:MAG: hypothetical protein ACO29Q_01080 [Crocinitomicaceae bacterium]|jgi:hypothetical protein